MTTIMRCHDGVVAEVMTLPEGVTVEAMFTPAIAALFEPAPQGAEAGMLWDGETLSPATYDAPLDLDPAPPDISDRQFARGLWGDGIITYDDFLGFIGPGTIPAPIQAIVNQLPDDDTGKPTPRKDAVGFLTGSKLYSFSHPLVEFFRQALAKDDPKWTVEYLRQQWLVWAML